MGSPRGARRRVRMLDVANSLGLSRATVSLVMRESPLVSEATRAAVLAEAERLGYVKNQAAASLRSQHNDLVGLVMPDVINPFVAEVSLGVQEILGEFGYFPMIANTMDRLELQHRILRSLLEQRAAGLVTIPALTSTASELDWLDRDDLPAVMLLRQIDGVDWPFVGTDEEGIGRMGVDHLVNTHHCRSLAYFGGNELASPRAGRLASFVQASADAGVAIDQDWSEGLEATADAAYAVASQRLKKGPPPEGVLCHSDNVAYGLLTALREGGYGPAACAVVGIDDLHMSAMWHPALSSIAVDPVDLGRVCGRLLLTEMGVSVDGPLTPAAPEMHARVSCGCA